MPIDKEVLAAKKASVKHTLACPYCDVKLEKFDVSGNAMGSWGTDLLYVCLNDECSYFRESVDVLAAQGAIGASYRLVYDPEKDWCGPAGAGTAWFSKR